MRDNLIGALVRLVVFIAACSTAMFALFAVFAQLRFESERTYNALFTNVSGLEEGQFVRIAGVEVGKVHKILVRRDANVLVEFGTDSSVILTRGTRAAIRYADLIGGRYLALEEGVGGTTRLRPGDTIPTANTSPALDLDALIGGFRPLFRALDPNQVNQLTGQLINALQGQGDTVGSFLTQTAALTNTLADRDQLIGEVITNLNAVLGSFGDQTKQFDKTVDSLSQLVQRLAEPKGDIAQSFAHANAAARSIADLLTEIRPPTRQVLHETDRAAGIILADHDYLDDLLKTLPDAYRVLLRQGLYGNYFNFYLCDAFLKVNGKGGQPVFVKLAGQATGRCTPR